MGYHRAGFDVTGVDIKPQPRYPFPFIQADALEYAAAHGREYDVIHASPPCQAYSRATAWRGDRSEHPDLIVDTRKGLLGHVYVIENVQEARRIMLDPLMLCGTMFGLRLQSHRYFEVSEDLPWTPLRCQHSPEDAARDHGAKQTEAAFRGALECGWMTVHEARLAIPPAYTEFIGRQLLAALR